MPIKKETTKSRLANWPKTRKAIVRPTLPNRKTNYWDTVINHELLWPVVIVAAICLVAVFFFTR